MENNNLRLIDRERGGGGGGGEGVYSGGSAVGSMSTVSKEDDLMLSSEVSSSCPEESELELGLGLSLGAGRSRPSSVSRGQHARILTAKDFPTLVSSSSPLSSSSSSSVVRANTLSAGTKRAADSVSPPRNGVSPVVGWPPIRTYRMNSLVNQARSPPTEEFKSAVEIDKSKVVDTPTSGKNGNDIKERGPLKTSQFVKVNMDGMPIGRKVNLNAHSCYETLAQTLEDMFCRPSTSMCTIRSSMKKHDVGTEAVGTSKLLDGLAEFVLTYEDKEGDWMLVGDVPWGMFLSSVKRLRIMRTSEANGLGPGPHGRNGRQASKPT